MRGHIAPPLLSPTGPTKALQSEFRPNNTAAAKLLVCSHTPLNTEEVNVKKSVQVRKKCETVALCLCVLVVVLTTLKQCCCYCCFVVILVRGQSADH